MPMPIQTLLDWAAWYRGKGWNVLPSKDCGGRFHPPFRYAHARDHGLSAASFRRIAASQGCTALQLALGVRWNLCVADLDGPEAVEVWSDLTRFRPVVTWEVERQSGGGRHLWFRIPSYVAALPHATWIWHLEGLEHTGIEVLGDGSLILAPPSVRGQTQYRFRKGRGPDEIAEPAELPLWLVELVRCAEEARRVPEPHVTRVRSDEAHLTLVKRRGGPHLDWEHVVAVADPVALAAAVGVRVVGRPNRSGWAPCRSVFREDRKASAMLLARARNGVPLYWDPASLGARSVDVFSLAVLTGRYASWGEAVDGIGRAMGVDVGASAGESAGVGA